MSSKKAREAVRLLRVLQELYPAAHCELHYQSPWQLLVATILSAQCTDKRVNEVTKKLFRVFPEPKDLAAATQEDVEDLIRSAGFFRNKSKNLILCAQQVLSRHQGQVPAQMDKLINLSGVGRKTANVILGNAYQIPGMVVDTHVKRLSYRFGWTRSTDPVKIEQDLCALIPAEDWTQMGHILIAHGRVQCKAPTPLCSTCAVVELCPRRGVVKAK